MSVVVVRDKGGRTVHVVKEGDVATGLFSWEDSVYYVRHSTEFKWGRESNVGSVTIEEAA